MRWWIALPLVVACSHGPAPLPDSLYLEGTSPARALPSDRAKALSATSAIPRPLDKPVTVLAFLCEDRSHVECPPCPEGADCAACQPPAWIFCDTPGALEPTNAIWVVDPPPGITLAVGQRYLLKGKKSDTRALGLDAIYYAD
jgi:hypothetical protein